MLKKILASLAMLVALVAPLQAQSFKPDYPVTATIGFAPGSGNEISFRAVSAIVEKTNPGTNFVVETRPGAGEIIALTHFGKQKTDGRSLYIVSQNNFALTEIWYPGRLDFKMDDLVLVTNIAKSPLCIITYADNPVSTPTAMINDIKNTKKPVTFGLGALGQKLVFEYIMDNVNGNKDLVKATLYKGPGPVVQDLAGKQIDYAIIPTAVAAPMVAAGKIKFIAITSEQKLTKIPDVPLMKDYVKDLNFYAAWAIALPPNSPKEQAEYYRKLFLPAINSKEAKEFFDNNMMLVFKDEHNEAGLRRTINKVNAQWGPYASKLDPNQ